MDAYSVVDRFTPNRICSRAGSVGKMRIGIVTVGFLLILAGVIFRPAVYLAILFCGAAILLVPNTFDIMCLLFSWMSVASIFKISAGGTSMFTFLELIAVCVFLLRDRKINGYFFAGFLALFVYLLPGVNGNYTEFIKVLLNPLLLYFFVRETDPSRLRTLSNYYISGVLYSSVLGYFIDIIPHLSEFVMYKTQGRNETLVTRFSGLMGDPNYYSIHLVLAITICIFFYMQKKLGGVKFWLLLALFSAFGAMTGSKSFLLMLLVLILSLIVFAFITRQYKKAILLFAVVPILLFLILSGKITLFSITFDRLLTSYQNQRLTTGRSDLWAQYLDIFKNDLRILFFGSGIGDRNVYRPVHNVYMEFVYTCGLCGSALFLGTFFLAARNGKKGSGPLIRALPLLIMLVMWFFLCMFYAYDFVYQMALAIMFFQTRAPRSSDQDAAKQELNLQGLQK